MINDEIAFHNREKLKFNELLSKIHWTDDCLLKEQEKLVHCPIDRVHHLIPFESKHVEAYSTWNERFSEQNLKQLTAYEQEKRSSMSITLSQISDTTNRITTTINSKNSPLTMEQPTVLHSPYERSYSAQTVPSEDLHVNIVTSTTYQISKNSKFPDQPNHLVELREQKRRRTKYVTRTIKKSFYDIAREMIDSGMKAIEKMNPPMDVNQIGNNKDQLKHIKHKHGSSSKRKHRSSRSHSREHHRHKKKKRRKS